MIDIENTHIIVPSSGGTMTIRVEYPDSMIIRAAEVSDPQDLINGDPSTGSTGDVIEYTFVFNTATTNSKIASVTFSASTTDNVWDSAVVYFSQAPNPIYGTLANDFNYTSAVSSFSYGIRTDDGIVFEGHAVKSPIHNTLTINFNELFHNYVKNDIGNIYAQSARDNDIYIDQAAERQFVVVDGSGDAVKEYQVLEGYSNWDGGEKVLSEPINGKIDKRAVLLFSEYTPTTKNIEWTITFRGLTPDFETPDLSQAETHNI